MLNREPMGMKPEPQGHGRDLFTQVSVLNREPMGMKLLPWSSTTTGREFVSVLNREPMGMKPIDDAVALLLTAGFSAQPRADGDEAYHLRKQEWADILFQCSTASRWG